MLNNVSLTAETKSFLNWACGQFDESELLDTRETVHDFIRYCSEATLREVEFQETKGFIGTIQRGRGEPREKVAFVQQGDWTIVWGLGRLQVHSVRAKHQYERLLEEVARIGTGLTKNPDRLLPREVRDSILAQAQAAHKILYELERQIKKER